jgi:hypothetical protein
MTASLIPACRVLTTGSPVAAASRTELGVPSESPFSARRECCTNTRAARSKSRIWAVVWRPLNSHGVGQAQAAG